MRASRVIATVRDGAGHDEEIPGSPPGRVRIGSPTSPSSANFLRKFGGGRSSRSANRIGHRGLHDPDRFVERSRRRTARREAPGAADRVMAVFGIVRSVAAETGPEKGGRMNVIPRPKSIVERGAASRGPAVTDVAQCPRALIKAGMGMAARRRRGGIGQPQRAVRACAMRQGD